jgi:hypothetical protein
MPRFNGEVERSASSKEHKYSSLETPDRLHQMACRQESGGVAIEIVAGLSGSVHDMKLFETNLDSVSSLIARNPQKPMKILADQASVSQSHRPDIALVTPKKKVGSQPLDREERRCNQILFSACVIVENSFGRLQDKFHLMVRRSGFMRE